VETADGLNHKDTKNGSQGSEMRGHIVAVSISEERGTRKQNVPVATLEPDLGIAGDAHAAPGIRQVSLLAIESIRKMQDQGVEVGPGDFAENITTEGLELFSLPVGTRLRLGESILAEVTQIGKECHDRCAIFEQVGDCVMPREGIFIRILQGGSLRPGDEIQVLDS
jgi:MOSC domain-containing protein YiiM